MEKGEEDEGHGESMLGKKRDGGEGGGERKKKGGRYNPFMIKGVGVEEGGKEGERLQW